MPEWLFILLIIMVLLIIGTPFFVVFGIGAVLFFLLYMHWSTDPIPQLFLGYMSSWSLMAIPLFILAGELMVRSGASTLLVNLLDDMVGHVPGGMALVTVLTCTVFSAFSGSSIACASALTPLLLPEMTRLGYDKRFSMGLLACGGTMDIMIPPSIPMIVLAEITEQSVAKIFAAGIIPGLVIAAMLGITAIIISWRRGYGAHPPRSWGQRRRSFVRSLPVLVLPVIILGGIFSGIFAPTEAAAIAAIYAAILAFFYQKGISWRWILDILVISTRSAIAVFAIIATAGMLGNVVAYSRLAEAVAGMITHIGAGALGTLFLINLFYFFAGMVIETVPLMVLTAPVFFAIAPAVGIHPIHLSVLTIINIEIAQVTPPVGVVLYALAGASGERFEEVARGIFLFLGPMLISLVILTLFPVLSAWLPGILVP